MLPGGTSLETVKRFFAGMMRLRPGSARCKPRPRARLCFTLAAGRVLPAAASFLSPSLLLLPCLLRSLCRLQHWGD